MPLPQDGTRGVFLEQASRFLAVSSPSTSAYVTAQRLEGMLMDQVRPCNELRSIFCMACGSTTVPGWTTSIFQDNLPAKRVRPRLSQRTMLASRRKQIVRTCNRCHRKTVSEVQLPPPPPVKTSQTKDFTRSTPPTSQSDGKGTEKPTAKQRAKEKRSRTELRIILSKSKRPTATTSTSLDLMDFMKT